MPRRQAVQAQAIPSEPICPTTTTWRTDVPPYVSRWWPQNSDGSSTPDESCRETNESSRKINEPNGKAHEPERKNESGRNAATDEPRLQSGTEIDVSGP
ncbi:hypothetical protein FOPE_03510 [Fonsecaea pedrosoi]|nr:hypothetical protein FOPE_03510 [Fonsecaea pedrosoi]